jgi:FtsP/CotA-like multicopper oxidase with cupredoxin domain
MKNKALIALCKALFLATLFTLVLYPVGTLPAAAQTIEQDFTTKPGCEYGLVDESGKPILVNESGKPRTDNEAYKAFYQKFGFRDFQNPASVSSENGVLEATLTVEYGKNQIGPCEVNLRSYNGSLTGPTLRVKPGETIKIHMANAFPPEKERRKTKHVDYSANCSFELGVPDPESGHDINEPHGFNTTNLHTHGLHVSPEGCSDNVLRVMHPKEKPDGLSPSYEVEVKLPFEHPSGTDWYHPHLHGATALQVSGGMSGAILVEGGGLDTIPEIAEAEQKIFLFQQISYNQRGEIEDYKDIDLGRWQQIGRFITINGQIAPVIKMQPGEVQRWRFIHGGLRETIRATLVTQESYESYHNYLEAQASGTALGNAPELEITPLHEIAVDGIAIGKMDSWDTVQLEPGYRSDVLVKADFLPQGTDSQEYLLIDRATPANQSLFGVPEPSRILAKIVVSGPTKAMSLPDDFYFKAVKLADVPPDITDEEVQCCQQLNFSIVQSFNMGPTPRTTIGSAPNLAQPRASFLFMVNNDVFGYNITADQTEFLPDRVVTLGTADEWILQTDERSLAPTHPFHIHINPFQHVRIGPDGQPEKIWRDTVLVTRDKQERIRTRYTDFPGSFVLHCHILDHEDQGMMELIRIVPNRKLSQ